MKKNKTMIVVFLTPAVLLFLGIFLYPIIRTVIMSFFKIDGVTDSMNLWEFVGFGNYTKLMNTSLFKTSFFNLFRICLFYLQLSLPAESEERNFSAQSFICQISSVQ